MTDEQFRQLKTMMLDMKLEIANMALAIRTMQARMEELGADTSEIGDIFDGEELQSLLKTRQFRVLSNDTE